MILKAETVAQIGWFQVPKDTYQKIGPQARSLLSKPKEKRQEGLYRQAMDERTY
jgi:hypothetical protein